MRRAAEPGGGRSTRVGGARAHRPASALRAARRPRLGAAVAALVLAVALRGPAIADERRIPPDLAEAVEAAVARASGWLRQQTAADGGFAWSVDGLRGGDLWNPQACDQGLTSLAILALVRAGVPRTDPTIDRALALLRRTLASAEPPAGGRDARTFTYGAGALLWMLSEVRPAGFETPAAQAALALARGLGADGSWGYGLPAVRVKDGYAEVLPAGAMRTPSDVSNAQFAVLGLLAAERLGVWRGDVAWGRVRDGSRAAAHPDGSFGYRADAGAPEPFARGRRTSTAMATATLVVALRRCGASTDEALRDPKVRRALAWLDAHPIADRATGKWSARDVGDLDDRLPYVEMLSIERLGAFTGLEHLGQTEWYRAGVRALLATQRADGSWPGGVGAAAFLNAVQNTTLALLFLTRAVDAIPVVSPAFTTGDLVGARDAPEPFFSDRVAHGVRGHAGTVAQAQMAWRRAFVTVGVPALDALVRLLREGPGDLAGPIDELLHALTDAAPPAGDRAATAAAWATWLATSRARLVASKDGTRFVIAP